MNNIRSLGAISLIFITVTLFVSCTATNQFYNKTKVNYINPSPTVTAYTAAGNYWGKKHKELHVNPICLDSECANICPLDVPECFQITQPPCIVDGCIDICFIEALKDKDKLNFFWIHPDLKEAFKKGYRFGYEDRTADLVLGPHLTIAASCIGKSTAKNFVDVINTFEKGWAETLKQAIDVFIVLISEGSQSDREYFINEFTKIYKDKYLNTQKMLAAAGFLTTKSEGGTTLFIDARKTLALLNIPSDATLKSEIYVQAFTVMGDEWGKRLSHNLVKREELIDILRRSKTALMETPESKTTTERLYENVGRIFTAFIMGYGTDAKGVFSDILVAAGYPQNIKPFGD